MNGYFLVGLEGGNIWNLLPAVNYLQDKVIITIVRDLTSCQDVNFREIQDMKRRSKHFGRFADFSSIAETFISGLSEIITICGGAPSNAEVWIKVCNLQSEETSKDSRYFRS